MRTVLSLHPASPSAVRCTVARGFPHIASSTPRPPPFPAWGCPHHFHPGPSWLRLPSGNLPHPLSPLLCSPCLGNASYVPSTELDGGATSNRVPAPQELTGYLKQGDGQLPLSMVGAGPEAQEAMGWTPGKVRHLGRMWQPEAGSGRMSERTS